MSYNGYDLCAVVFHDLVSLVEKVLSRVDKVNKSK